MPSSPYPHRRRRLPAAALVCTIVAAGACAGPSARDRRPILRYVGSSTVANLLRDAVAAYPGARLSFDTEPESVGGELAILQGRADLAGVAGKPGGDTLAAGVEATLIGRDAIAVIVHRDNPVAGLTSAQLRAVFTGRATRWAELGGTDLLIQPHVVGPASATRKVFRSTILGREGYGACTVVRPDGDMVERVARDPAAIGQISISFLANAPGVRVLEIDGVAPGAGDNSAYPITRPLHILSWPGRASVAQFIGWCRSHAGREAMRRASRSSGSTVHGSDGP